MAWDDKLLTTIADFDGTPMLRIVFRSFPPAEANYIRGLRHQVPFVPDDYERFLSITDGASLWMYELYGSGGSEMPALSDLHSRWQANIEKLKVFAFAEDPSGYCIATRESGEVVQFDFRAETDADCIVLAPSFGEFLDDVLMGERFYSLFDVPASEIEDNEWLEYLRQKGWFSMSSA